MRKVLIIDDETTVLRTVGEMLGMEGYEVSIAVDGADGIDMATAQPPDLIICDLMMPGYNGFDVLRALRGQVTTQKVPVIIITGIRDDYVFQQILDTGGSAYLAKPFTRDVLFGVIRSVL